MANNEPLITIRTVIYNPIEKVWKCWITPSDIVQWNHASDEWHTTAAINDLQPGGKFNYRMEAKDGSFAFDFSGTYNEVIPEKLIKYTLDDGRKVTVWFTVLCDATEVVEAFEPENSHPIELQRDGWQMILNNFKHYTEQA
jgi:uncharacterized protein YndB with AHSA1/START domain